MIKSLKDDPYQKLKIPQVWVREFTLSFNIELK